MALQTTGRCPRCGYVLRYDGLRVSCDFCGYPRRQRTLTGRIQELERGLKAKIQNLVEGARSNRVQQVVTYYPLTMQQQRRCVVCGIILPLGIQNCPNCGAIQVATQPNPPTPRTTYEPQSHDQKVLDYIVAHNGTISISQAAQDLSLSPEALRSTLERLKAAGFLNQA